MKGEPEYDSITRRDLLNRNHRPLGSSTLAVSRVLAGPARRIVLEGCLQIHYNSSWKAIRSFILGSRIYAMLPRKRYGGHLVAIAALILQAVFVDSYTNLKRHCTVSMGLGRSCMRSGSQEPPCL